MIQYKVSAFCNYFKLTKDAFNINEISNEDDFIETVVALFKDNRQVFNSFLFRIIDLRVRAVLDEKYSIMGFRDDESIDHILPVGRRSKHLNDLESETGLIFPRLVLSKSSFIIQLLLFLGPALLFIGLIIIKVEFVVVLFGVVKLGILFFLLVIPYVMAYFLFPSFFNASKLSGINSYEDLINDLVLMNRYRYEEEDFSNTREELRGFIETL